MVFISRPHTRRHTVREAATLLPSMVLIGFACALAACATPGAPQDTSQYAIVDGEQTPAPSIPMGAPATIRRILDEGLHHNQVMEHLWHFCEEIGPRLTGSSNAREASEWARDQFEAWGLSNAHLQKWGEIGMRFDRLPSTGRVLLADDDADSKDGEEAEDDDDVLREVEFTWLAWSRGTDGPVRGACVPMPRTLEEYNAVKDQLAGAWVMIHPDYSGRRGRGGMGGSARARHEYFEDIRERMDAGEFAEPPAQVATSGVPDAVTPEGPLAGRWVGTITGPRAPRGTRFFVELSRDEGGALVGTGGIGGYRVSDLTDLAYDEASGALSFTWQGSGGPDIVKMTISGESMEGTLRGKDDGDDEEPYVLDLERESEQVVEDAWTKDYLTALVLKAAPAGFVASSKDERVWTTSIGGWRDLTKETVPQDVQVIVRESDHDFIMARLAQGLPVELEFDLACEMVDGPIAVHNTIAEIPGTTWPEQVVIVSGHLDSWNGPGSLGTIDNGTGSSVTLETARILMAAGAKPKRTIRFILWTGEEQGLLGSRAYVESLSEEELANISAVFVDDGGTNYEGGLHCIAPMADYLAAATAPINGQFFSPIDARRHPDEPDAGWLNVDIQVEGRMPRGGGSDHASFNRAGVPGFFWDEAGRANYGYGWHTQNDRIDQAIPLYLKQSSTCAAVTAYNLACAPELLPRQAQDEPDAGDEDHDGGEGGDDA